jgi:hypothetical protein
MLFAIRITGLNAACPGNSISTNPASAFNSSAPHPKFINQLNWFAQSNNQLLNIPINELNDYYAVNDLLKSTSKNPFCR